MNTRKDRALQHVNVWMISKFVWLSTQDYDTAYDALRVKAMETFEDYSLGVDLDDESDEYRELAMEFTADVERAWDRLVDKVRRALNESENR